MAASLSRAGHYEQQPTGYRAFVPAPLPPDPPIRFDAGLARLLSRADQAVGRLDGIAQILPNPDLFVAMYVRREAVDSSQIEGTQSTLEDVLAFELNRNTRSLPNDVEEVVNYVRAMNYGIDRLATLPLSLRLIREIHAELLQGVRGADKSPGRFRTTQNWIGAGRVTLADAAFVPPPVPEMMRALDNLERFLHEDQTLPALITCGLAHAQFETIHPFLDGNGRVGRLLIAFLLVHRGILHRPLLYISTYLKHWRSAYYDRLMAVRVSGDWEGWLRFFLDGVAATADEATIKVHAIIQMREAHRALIQGHGAGIRELSLLDFLFQRPLVNVGLIVDTMNVAPMTANRMLGRLVDLGLIDEITGWQRNRVFRYTPYWELFQEPAVLDQTPAPAQSTGSDS